MESQIWSLPAVSVGYRLREGTMASVSTSLWEKAAPPGIALMPDTSAPPCVPPVPFELLPITGTQSECVCVSPCADPLRRIAWDSRSPRTHFVTIPTGFYRERVHVFVPVYTSSSIIWEIYFQTYFYSLDIVTLLISVNPMCVKWYFKLHFPEK